MKRALWIAIIANAAIVSACTAECDYEAHVMTARVSLTPASSAEIKNCADNPVEVNLTWNDGSDQFQTTDHYNPPRSCVESLGLVDGAEVKVLVEETTGGGFGLWNGLVVCGDYTTTLLDIDPTACDAACDQVPVCPTSEPTAGDHCFGNLVCHYGDPIVCEPGPGTSMYYECSNGVWTFVEKNNCDVCGVSCGLPPAMCFYCFEMIFTVPPEPYPFCTPASEMIYDALMTCTCDPGNACASVCNTAVCSTGEITPECQTCLTAAPQPNGCQAEFNACINGF